MTRTLSVLLASAAIVTAGACQKDSTPIKTTSAGATNLSAPADSAAARGHSLVRVVNAVDGGKNIAVQVDDTTLFDDVKAGSVTDYREIANTLATFSVRPTGASEGMSVGRNDEVLMDGNRYTVVLVSEDVSKNTLRVIKDDLVPDSGKAHLRLLHAAPGGPTLDVSIAGSADTLFFGVDYKSEVGYKDVTPGTVTLELRAKDERRVLLRIPKLALKRGTATTVVITGATKLNFFTFRDSIMAPTPKA